MKPYYQDDACTIYHGDCRDFLGLLEADACLADPPYGDTSLHWDKQVEGWLEDLQVDQLWCFGSMRLLSVWVAYELVLRIVRCL